MANYDAIVIGTGNNGLAATTVLAKNGVKVLALEKNSYVGGMAATVELFEGFKFDIAAGILFPLSTQVIDGLELENCGLERIERMDKPSIESVSIMPGQTPLISSSDPDQNDKHLKEDHGGDETLQRMAEFQEFCNAAAEPIDRFTELRPAKSLGAIIDAAPTIKAKDMLRRAYFGSAMDVIDEFFPDPEKHKQIRALLSFMSVQSASMGPYSPGNAFCLIYSLASNPKINWQGGRRIKGGMGKLMEGLQRLAEQNGGEVRLSSPVKKVLVENGRAVGVELESGEKITAAVVLSNLDPYSTFIRMVGEDNLSSDFIRMVKRINFNGTYLQMFLTLKELPEYTGEYSWLNDLRLKDGGVAVSLRQSPEELEQCWDDCKYGRIPKELPWSFGMPSLPAEGMGKPGYYTVSIYTYYFPVTAPRDQHARLRDEMADRIIDKITGYAPNFRDAIENMAIFAPYHYESMFGCTNGDFCHGLIRPEQMCDFRPVVGWSRYKTPVENLYLCGSGCHPGPGVTFLPGYNCAHEVLKSQRR